MDIFEETELQDCPFCGGAGLLEEENHRYFYVTCVDCGSQTAPYEYRRVEDREETAGIAAHMWNIGKVNRANPNE